MRLLATIIFLIIGTSSVLAQSTWHPGSFSTPTGYGISSFYNNRFTHHHTRVLSPERVALLKKYKSQYKKAFSGSLSVGYNQFVGDLSGATTDFFPQMGITASINKRTSPNFAWKAVATIGNYQTQGGHSNPNVYTGDTPSPYNSGDFHNSIVTGSWSSFSLMRRRKISFSRVRSIDDERKFACFFSWGVGYINSHVLIVSMLDEDARISRTIETYTVPVMLDFSYLIKNNLGAMISFDTLYLGSDNLDLLRDDTLDLMHTIRCGVFFKIDN